MQVFLHENKEFVEMGFFSMRTPWVQFEWKKCPFIDYQAYNKKVINEGFSDICEFIKTVIKNKYYVFLNTYRLEEIKHEIFISGYDDEKKMFLCWDFWNWYYKPKWMDYSEMRAIYERMDGRDDWMRNAVITIASVYDIYGKEHEEKVVFGKEDFKSNLSYWLDDHERKNNAFLENKTVGKEIYDELIKALTAVEFPENLNYVVFHFIVERARIISQAYKDLYGKEGIYCAGFENLINLTKQLELLVVYIKKCASSEKWKEKISGCIKVLEEIQMEETNLFKLCLLEER